TREDQEALRKLHARGPVRPLTPYAEANANKPRVEHADAPAPPFLGRRSVDVPLAEAVEYIDWTFFFTACELKGRYPDILQHPKYGEAARELFDSAKPILARILEEDLFRARGVYGYWPAASDGNDIVLYTDASRSSEAARFPM